MTRRLIFAIAFILMGLNAFCQMEIDWGKRFYDIKDSCKKAEIIAEDIDGYYFYYCMNEYIGQGDFEYKYYIVRTDKDCNVIKVARIDFGNPKYQIEQTWRCNDLVGFMLSKNKQDKVQTPKRSRSKTKPTATGKQNLYVQWFHLKDMRLMDKPEKFVSFNYFADSAQKPYLFKFSENKTKMVFCLFRNDTNGKVAQMRIYDNRLNMLWEKDYELKNIQSSSYKVADIAVNNDGDRALLAINSYSSGKKITHLEDKAFLIHLTKYQNAGFTLTLDKAWPTDMQCCFNLEGDYLLAGYYGINNDNPTYAAGTFCYLFDRRRNYQKNFSFQEFKDYETDDMVAPYKAPKKKVRGQERPYRNSNDLVIPSKFTTHLDYLVPMIGGNVIMVGEQRFDSKVMPGKRRGDKPTGENAAYYRDIVISNIDNTGFITGNNFIAKRQKERNGSNDYNGYALTRDRYGMYIMFNDHIANYKDGKYTPVRQYDSDRLRTQVNFVQIYSDGSCNWLQSFKSKDIKEMMFYKTLMLTHDKYIVFLTHYSENSMLGKFHTR